MSNAKRLAELQKQADESDLMNAYDAFNDFAFNHAAAIAQRERELEEENQQLTNDLQETRNAHADIARGVKKALNIGHWPEDWKGDTFQGLVCRLVQEQLAAKDAEIERLSRRIEQLSKFVSEDVT